MGSAAFDKEGEFEHKFSEAVGSELHRHVTDAKLRGFGFKILQRPKKAPAVWERNGVLYTQQEAEKEVQNMLKSVEKGKGK